MAADPNGVEQAVSRTLRDNLEKIQRTADELHQAVNDMASACASSRASNALPSMLRAQTSAAALSATLEVLARFVTSAMQTPTRLPFESEAMRIPAVASPQAGAFEQPPPLPVHPKEETSLQAPAPAAPARAVREMPPLVAERPAVREIPPPVEVPAFASIPPVAELPRATEPPIVVEPAFLSEPAPNFDLEIPAEVFPVVEQQAPVGIAEAPPVFNLDLLPPEEQELHRRAFRVAKVSMQDIRMLRPEDVRLGREKKDLCFRLRDDIEKAHKEYNRRFQSIQSHPVDYFYDWMVEILGGGDPQALGEYPYPSAVVHR
jgi:hypothetical protein